MRRIGIVILYCIAAGAACGTDGQLPYPYSDRRSDSALMCQDDGPFCNGIRRPVQGKGGGADAVQCVLSPAAPCDDGVDCTLDTCDEATRTCAHTLIGKCATCAIANCTPDCGGKRCGSDGCNGSCGACRVGQGCTPLGVCVPANGLGTCARPRPLAVRLGEDQVQVIHGDTTRAISQLTPTCNPLSNAPEDIYTFTLTAPTGIQATSHDFDTVLYLRKEDPADSQSECLDDRPAATVACNDDASPPGDYGSRVSALLPPGTYYLVVDGFSDDDFGPYTLTVKFIAGCAPNCDGKYCGGSDGCGGTCGSCAAREQCGPDLRCRPYPCKPRCTNLNGSPRVCGDDGCLGVCGRCPGNQLCVPKTGTCASFAVCDHKNPTCSPACGAGSFCGSDCACYSATQPLPDLIVNQQRLKDEILFDWITVDQYACSVVEQCVGGLGRRRLLRFTVEAINQGQGPLEMGAPAERPDRFIFSACHGHYHFSGFASYALLDQKGNEVLHGQKQGFCLEDTRQVEHGPSVACRKHYDCTYQGIQAGWADVYGNSLDCQWLDITDVPAGDYLLRAVLNPDLAFQEVTPGNNTAVVPVHIPPP